jgi:hypothetical protein
MRLTISACLLLSHVHAVAYTLLTLRVFRTRSLSLRLPGPSPRTCSLTVLASSVRGRSSRTETAFERRSTTPAVHVRTISERVPFSPVRYLRGFLVLVVHVPTRDRTCDSLPPRDTRRSSLHRCARSTHTNSVCTSRQRGIGAC